VLLPLNAGYHQLLKISEVFDGEPPTDQPYLTPQAYRHFENKTRLFSFM
jgi:hypothetical protein